MHDIALDGTPGTEGAGSTPSMSRFLVKAGDYGSVDGSNVLEETPKTPRESHKIRQSKAITDLYAFSSTLSMGVIQSPQFQAYSNAIASSVSSSQNPTKKVVHIPCAATIVKNVDMRYKMLKKIAIETIAKHAPRVIGVVMDIWSEKSGTKRSFLNVQAQYSVDFKVRNVNLTTEEIPEQKTAENIADRVFQVLLDFGLDER